MQIKFNRISNVASLLASAVVARSTTAQLCTEERVLNITAGWVLSAVEFGDCTWGRHESHNVQFRESVTAVTGIRGQRTSNSLDTNLADEFKHHFLSNVSLRILRPNSREAEWIGPYGPNPRAFLTTLPGWPQDFDNVTEDFEDLDVQDLDFKTFPHHKWVVGTYKPYNGTETCECSYNVGENNLFPGCVHRPQIQDTPVEMSCTAGPDCTADVPVCCDAEHRVLIQRYDEACDPAEYTWTSELDESVCGYLIEPLVRKIAASATGIELEVKRLQSSWTATTNNTAAVEALRTGTHWQTVDIRDSWVQSGVQSNCLWSRTADQNYDPVADGTVTRWPDMYSSQPNTDCLHWVANNGYNFYAAETGAAGSRYADNTDGVHIHSSVWSTLSDKKHVTTTHTYLVMKPGFCCPPVAHAEDFYANCSIKNCADGFHLDGSVCVLRPTEPAQPVMNSTNIPSQVTNETQLESKNSDPLDTEKTYSESTTAIVIVLLHIPVCILLAVCVIVSRRRRAAQKAKYLDKYPHLMDDVQPPHFRDEDNPTGDLNDRMQLLMYEEETQRSEIQMRAAEDRERLAAQSRNVSAVLKEAASCLEQGRGTAVPEVPNFVKGYRKVEIETSQTGVLVTPDDDDTLTLVFSPEELNHL